MIKKQVPGLRKAMLPQVTRGHANHQTERHYPTPSRGVAGDAATQAVYPVERVVSGLSERRLIWIV
jgi:hypothetical protein